ERPAGGDSPDDRVGAPGTHGLRGRGGRPNVGGTGAAGGAVPGACRHARGVRPAHRQPAPSVAARAAWRIATMLLAIDVGNTETVVGIFQGDRLTWHWRYSTVGARTADELALLLGGFLEHQGLSFSGQITGVAVASVVPDQTQALRSMVGRYLE